MFFLPICLNLKLLALRAHYIVGSAATAPLPNKLSRCSAVVAFYRCCERLCRDYWSAYSHLNTAAVPQRGGACSAGHAGLPGRILLWTASPPAWLALCSHFPLTYMGPLWYCLFSENVILQLLIGGTKPHPNHRKHPLEIPSSFSFAPFLFWWKGIWSRPW